MESKDFFKNELLHKNIKINNLYFFENSNLFETDEETKRKKENILNETNQDLKYELFLKQKSRRPYRDIYASFQPFNEAAKAIYPFVATLQKKLLPNDIILNLWDRSGWFTSLLSGLFPKQQIISTWEGNKDVLGYKGFHFWTKSLPNVNIVFCDLKKPLPFKDNCIACTIGFDILHRLDPYLILSELDRVVKNNGFIFFPHVHLSNSNPEPFFERGGKLLHGEVYQNSIQKLFANSNRNCFVFSEPELFAFNDLKIKKTFPLQSNPNTTDYNGLIALLPSDSLNSNLSVFGINELTDVLKARIIVNELITINLHQQIIVVDSKNIDENVKHLFDRHPVYVERIKLANNYKLSVTEAEIIYLSQFGYTIEQIVEKLNKNVSTIIPILENLEKIGVIQVLPISEVGLKLQNYLMTQEYHSIQKNQNLKTLWENCLANFPNKIAIFDAEDESEFTYSDCQEIITYINNSLTKQGFIKGDSILICQQQHTEALLLFWACTQLGIIVIPVSEDLSQKSFTQILALTNCKLCFTNVQIFEKHFKDVKDISIVVFDDEKNKNHQGDFVEFSNWIETSENTFEDKMNTISTNDIAVILFTSGTTSTPKGVQLTHGNLYRSSLHVSETFHWNFEDLFFPLGGIDSMSGLRNTAITGLHVGASVVIPKQYDQINLLNITESIFESKSTILGTNPSFLRQLVKYQYKIKPHITSLKTIICTGNQLTNELREDFKLAFQLPIYNYYGLTETSGICIGQSKSECLLENETIGKPIGCIAQVVDENDELVAIGEQGELRIFSENIMQSYFKNEEQTKKVIKNNWFYTQDIAKYDSLGNLYLLGRKQNIIKTAEEILLNLKDIEEIINELPEIDDVVVLSYREEDVEKLKTFIVLNSAFKNIDINLLIENQLQNKFGTIKLRNKVVVLDRIPYSSNGKVLKDKLLTYGV